MSQKKLSPQGKLIYIMGASGAGKDSLLNALYPLMDAPNEDLHGQRPLVIMQRHITRAPSAKAQDEQHKACTEEDFLQALKQEAYALHWQSHGLHYGIPQSIRTHLAQGALVLVNGSREYLATAKSVFPNLIPLLVQVKPDVLRARLMARGRESTADIEKRVQRASLHVATSSDMIVIDNSQALESTLYTFKELIQRLRLE